MIKKFMASLAVMAAMSFLPVQAEESSWGVTGMMINPPQEGNKVTVMGVFSNTPADMAGISPGDELVSVDGTVLSGLDFVGVMEVTHGKNGLYQEGTSMVVVFRHNGELKKATVDRLDINKLAPAIQDVCDQFEVETRLVLLLVI